MRRIIRFSAGKALLLILAGTLLGTSLSARAEQGGQYHPGKFVWFDLVTDDLKTARSFYGSVFDWKFHKVGKAPGSYTYAELAGARIGGMFYRAAPEGARHNARWLSLISVPDVGLAARYAEERGGAVLVAPAALKGRGTHALLRDPQGAVFGVLKAEAGDRPDIPVETGDFFWVDLLARDLKQAAEFYSGLAGYEVGSSDDSTIERLLLSSQDYARAGILPLPELVDQPGWLPYVLVDDVPATLNKTLAAGGKVIVQPRPDVLNGNLAVIADPSGGVLGIVNWTERNGTEETK